MRSTADGPRFFSASTRCAIITALLMIGAATRPTSPRVSSVSKVTVSPVTVRNVASRSVVSRRESSIFAPSAAAFSRSRS